MARKKQSKTKTKASSSKNIENTIFNNEIQTRLREALFLIIAAMSIFMLIALTSHNNLDPGWSKISSRTEIINLTGSIGAWASDFALYFFGYVAFLIPIGILLMSAKVLREEQAEKAKAGFAIWALNFFGLSICILGVCAISDMHLPRSETMLPTSQGGVIGAYASVFAQQFVNKAGAELIFVVFVLLGLTLAFGVSWILLCEKFGRGAIAAIKRIRILLNKLFIYLVGKFSVLRAKATTKMKERNVKEFLTPIFEAKAKSDSVKKEPVLIEAIPVKEIVKEDSKAQKVVSNNSKELEKVSEKAPVKILTTPSYSYSQSPLKSDGESFSIPGVDLLEDDSINDTGGSYSEEDLQSLAASLEQHLRDFGIDAKVEGILPGPIITRFELSLGAGTKVSKITSLSKDLARSLLVTSVRIVEVIPGKSFIGIEVPNKEREVVHFADVIKSPQYQNGKSQIPLALGKDISGTPIIADLARMPHLLVAGTTGSGKSVGINAMLLSMLYRLKVEDLRMLLIDPKMLELSIYEGIPHLLAPVITDMSEAANGLKWCVAEMERRYELLASLGVRNLKSYNEKIEDAKKRNKPILDPTFKGDPSETPVLEKLPYIVVIIDEFADMIMVVGKKVEELIARIAQKARAAGIHMILATQRPSVDVITGLIKANVPTRISFQVSSKIDSRTILDQQGAEQLLGHGDMLYLAPGTGIPTRVHGPFVADETVHSVVQYFKDNFEAPMEQIELNKGGFDSASGFGSDDVEDDMYSEAINIVLETGKTSSSYLQRRLKIGYNRAARIVEAMESNGVLGPMQSNGVREILLNRE